MFIRGLTMIAAVAAVSHIAAQTQPAFDAASVKPVDPGDRVNSYTRSNEFMGSLQALIRYAYGVEDYRIAGGPKWLEGDKFSVVYKPSGPQANLMLRALLAERFKLAVHTETKELPVYALRVAKNGPKMEKADKPGGTSSGGAMIRGTMDMSTFVSYLSSTLGRRVMDETELTGPYTLSLKWTPDDQPTPASDGAPSLVTAIQEQLGLRLESTKGPVEILVIDHAEKPSAN
jgi:uncharacterized protein (TIGR03435 family)